MQHQSIEDAEYAVILAERESQRLREYLELYADPANWEPAHALSNTKRVFKYTTGSNKPQRGDGWQLARQGLAGEVLAGGKLESEAKAKEVKVI